MKTIDVDSLPEEIARLLTPALHERVLLTKSGKPLAVVSDASNLDEEDIGYLSDPAFWTMIAQRRKRRGGVSIEEAYRRLETREAVEASQQPNKANSDREGSK